MNSDSLQADYLALTPDRILDALEQVGIYPETGLLALNSYENRVYQFKTEDRRSYVVKFYRPQRWSWAQIEEEHQFSLALAEADIPVVAPLLFDGHSLLQSEGYWLSVFPCRGGRTLELDSLDHLTWMGRFIARLHLVGEQQPFQHRPKIDCQRYGVEPLHYLQQHNIVPMTLQTAYFSIAEQVLQACETVFNSMPDVAQLRLHADCHPSNVIWTDAGPHFVDFDDARMGPAVQDLWMLLHGEAEQMALQLDAILEGYEEFRDFSLAELRLIEPLRALRMLHYSAWLARRWHDPAFPRNFPWFAEDKYWEQQILGLKEQLANIQQAPLLESAIFKYR